jgi:hypothetical protein
MGGAACGHTHQAPADREARVHVALASSRSSKRTRTPVNDSGKSRFAHLNYPREIASQIVELPLVYASEEIRKLPVAIIQVLVENRKDLRR